MTKKLILLAFFSLCAAVSSLAFADAPTQSNGPCGPNCHCGCHTGKPCKCASPETCGLNSKDSSQAESYTASIYEGDYTQNEDSTAGAHPQSAEFYYAQTEENEAATNGAVCACAAGGSCTCGSSCGCGVLCNYNTNWTSDGLPPPCYNPCRAPAMNEIGPGYDVFIARSYGKRGVWLPEDPVLYRNMIADPRQICYSAGWRFNDRALVKNVIDVSFGDSLPLYRWLNVGPWGGSLQIDIDGAVWVTFGPLEPSSPLLNADYFGGVPITYACGDWSYRLRAYHISCHIGDEFLLDHPDFDRRNASAEFVDFFASCDWTDQIRFYAGLGYVIAQDKEFLEKRLWAEAGTEVRFRDLGFTDWANQAYGEPILGMHFRFRKNFKHHVDATYVLGYEWGKLCGLARKFRVFMEYHDGYSLEGQRSNTPTHYFSLRMSYGY